MYCRNCGDSYKAEQAVICVRCGCPKGQGHNFCPNCGNPVPPNSTVCLSCGVSLLPNATEYPNAKSKLTAGLLGVFLGGFGVHNFYLGYTERAFLQIGLTLLGILTFCLIIGWFLFLGMYIWGMVEGIMILAGKIDKDSQGYPLRD